MLQENEKITSIIDNNGELKALTDQGNVYVWSTYLVDVKGIKHPLLDNAHQNHKKHLEDWFLYKGRDQIIQLTSIHWFDNRGDEWKFNQTWINYLQEQLTKESDWITLQERSLVFEKNSSAARNLLWDLVKEKLNELNA